MALLARFFSSIYSWISLVLIMVIVIAANAFYVVSTLDQQALLETRLQTTNRIIHSLHSLEMSLLKLETGRFGEPEASSSQGVLRPASHIDAVKADITAIERDANTSELAEQGARIQALLRSTQKQLDELVNNTPATPSPATPAPPGIYPLLQADIAAIMETEKLLQARQIGDLRDIRHRSTNTLIISSCSAVFLLLTIFILLRMNQQNGEMLRQQLLQDNEALEQKVQERTQALELYSEELKRSNRELEDFAFVASHDMQEPLRKIRAFGDRLKTGYADNLDQRGQDFLQRMLKAAERMSLLISDLLAFSRIATRGKPFENVELNNVIADVREDLELVIEETNASLQTDALPVIAADRSQMEQLFLNLLSNALKFRSPTTQPSIRIQSATPTPDELEGLIQNEDYSWVKITVSDNGIGFDPAFEDKIFAPFQRLNGRTEYEGTGIGLAVCRRIVERHNGAIRAESSPGKGTRMVIVLPVNGELFENHAQTGPHYNDD